MQKYTLQYHNNECYVQSSVDRVSRLLKLEFEFRALTE